MSNAKNRRKITLAALTAALAVAVYLNWEYAKADAPFIIEETATAVAENTAENSLSNEGENGRPILEALPEKNYGDAQLVSTGASGISRYFEEARLSRTKTRDEALDTMQTALKNSALTADEKKTVTQTLAEELNKITLENSIESTVKAKGFADCIAFIEGNQVNLAVKTSKSGLNRTEAARLRDIILSKTDVSAQNISIVEVK